jgi:hypothetical protein
MHLDLMTGRHMVIKTLLMQNLSYAHYLFELLIIFIIKISVRPQRCCHQAFAAHMPACLLNAKSRLHAVSSSGQRGLA